MSALKRKSSTLTLISVLLLILIVSGGIFIIYLTNAISLDAETINELGVVRGSSQKLVKLELAGMKSNGLRRDIKKKIDDFSENDIRLYRNDVKVKETLDELNISWSKLDESILNYRENPSTKNKINLIGRSEDIWNKSHDIVSMSQLLSEVKVKRYRISLVFFSIDVILAVFIIFLIRKYVKNTLEYLVDYDGLTNIYNKRYFDEILEHQIIKAKKQNRDLSLIILDIDYFKNINDTYGHDVGDIILKEISELVKDNLEKDNIFSRIGGEEFAVITPNMNKKEACRLAEKIRRLVVEHDFSYLEKRITISLGVSEYTEKDDSVLLFKRGDISLYKAKYSGRNCVC